MEDSFFCRFALRYVPQGRAPNSQSNLSAQDTKKHLHCSFLFFSFLFFSFLFPCLLGPWPTFSESFRINQIFAFSLPPVPISQGGRPPRVALPPRVMAQRFVCTKRCHVDHSIRHGHHQGVLILPHRITRLATHPGDFGFPDLHRTERSMTSPVLHTHARHASQCSSSTLT